MEGHKGIEDFHTILVHHYVVDHCYSAINSFNIRLTDDELSLIFFCIWKDVLCVQERKKIPCLIMQWIMNENIDE